MLRITGLAARYADREVFRDVSLSVEPGMTECIIGPTGCGKTTLLMTAAGLKEPSAGSVLLDGTPVEAGDRRLSVILQSYGLFPWFTVLENAALGLLIRGVPAAERKRAAADALAQVGLTGLESRYPSEISGGQAQRAAIARSLTLSPQVLLMDEPFSALDALTREALQDLLLALLRGRRMAVVLVTHSIEEAAYLGSAVTLMAGIPGRIITRFPNPSRGAEGYRGSRACFELCREVRASMVEHKVL